MFKPIPGNHNLLVSLNGEIRNNDGNKINLSIVNNIDDWTFEEVV